MADFLGYEHVAKMPTEVDAAVTSLVRPDLARMYGVVPIRADEVSISVLAKDPFNHSIIDDLTFALNRDIEILVCDPDALDTLLIKSYGEETSSIDDVLGELGDDLSELSGEASDSELADAANQTPIIRFVNLVLQQAIKDKASDIHFEPFEDEFRIRYRIDGALYEMAPPRKNWRYR